MSENKYVFIKDNRVENTLIFSHEDEALASLICDEQGYDEAIYIGDGVAPDRWSTYDGKTFTKPTEEYLISIDILRKPVENGEV